jgi:hypothetical protein
VLAVRFSLSQLLPLLAWHLFVLSSFFFSFLLIITLLIVQVHIVYIILGSSGPVIAHKPLLPHGVCVSEKEIHSCTVCILEPERNPGNLSSLNLFSRCTKLIFKIISNNPTLLQALDLSIDAKVFPLILF